MRYIMNFDDFVNEEKFINLDFHENYAKEILDSGVELDLELNEKPNIPDWIKNKCGGDDLEKPKKDCEKRFLDWEKIPEDEREKKHYQRMSKKMTELKAIANVAVAAKLFGEDHVFTLGYLDSLIRYHGFDEDDVKEIFKKK